MKIKHLLHLSVFLLILSALMLSSCNTSTAVDGDCPEWTTITSGDIGKEVCIRGIVKRAWYEEEQSYSYVFFSGDVNEFFLGFPDEIIDSGLIGDCYMASGWVEETDYGTPYIVPDEFTRCRAEQQVVPTESAITELPITAADFDTTNCMNWDEVQLSQVGQEVCVKGNAWTTYFEDDEYGGFFYIDFGGGLEDIYFAIDGANLAGIEGHCVVAKGILAAEEGWNIPYLWLYPEELFHCDP